MRPLRLRLLALPLAAMVAAGCQWKPGTLLPAIGVPKDGVSQTIPLIEGHLEDGMGHPVANAAVRAYVAPYQVAGLATTPPAAKVVQTDARGDFAFADAPLGSVTVEASRGTSEKALRLDVMVTRGQEAELGTLVLHPTGSIHGHVAAGQGEALLGTDVFIPGTDYLAKAATDGSYQLDGVPEGTFELAATRAGYQPRVVEGVQVTGGQTTEAPILQLSLDAPVLQGLSLESGGPGTEVTLTGANFGATKHTTLQVTFNDTLASTVRRVSDTEIVATVPAGATSGGVVVISNGVASQPLPFQVVSRLQFVSGDYNVALYPGASHSFRVTALDARGQAIARPFVTWALGDPALGTLSASGDFVPTGMGATSVRATSGTVGDTAWVGVSPYQASTLYGSGNPGSDGDGGSATGASIGYPESMAMDAQGNLYVAQNSPPLIRRIAPDGTITRFAGTGENGTSGDGSPALYAKLGSVMRLAVDDGQRLWISDALHHVLRFIPLDDRDAAYSPGTIYRGAGSGIQGYSGSGLSATQSMLNAPYELAPAPDGVYVADAFNGRIRLVRPDGTLVDALGTAGVPNLSSPTAQDQAALGYVSGCATDAVGNLALLSENRLAFWCRVGGTYFGQQMQAGWVYPLAGTGLAGKFRGDGSTSGVLPLQDPDVVQFDGAGNCWLTDVGHGLVRRVTTGGRLDTVMGRPYDAASGAFLGDTGLAMNSLGRCIAAPGGLWVRSDSPLVASFTYHRIFRLSVPTR